MKKLLTVLLSLLLVISLFGCANNQGNDPVNTPDNSTNYPVTITDQAKREVTIESKPEKIVSGYYISSSAVIALGLQDKMVGIEAKANKRAIYSLSAPELTKLPSVGSAKEFDLEGCIALKPDLVILPKKLKDAAKTMEELGISVILVNPEDQQLLIEMIEIIAVATDTVDEGKILTSFISAQQQMLEEALKDVEAPRVYISGNSDFYTTAGKNMFQSYMVTLAKGSNVAEAIEDTSFAKISIEQLLEWDPEYIILAGESTTTVEDVLNDPALATVTAVVNKNVYMVPSNAESWDSPVPSGILGSVWLAHVLHPDKINEEKCYSIIGEFYETFYNFIYEK